MSLKARLGSRKRPTDVYALRIDDDTAARRELAAAMDADADPSRVEAARAAVDACYEQVTITALAPVDMEDLLEAHPPVDPERKTMFNPVTFVPALLAACVESDVTKEDWAEYTTKGPMTTGEANELFRVVWELNYRTPDPSVPKG